jgi:DNA polymerase-3 subunit delta'
LRATLERTLATGRVSSAYLLEGPDGLALRSAAQELAAALICPEGRLGCPCASCVRVRAGTHPDLVRVRRDRPTVISVEALEPVLAQAHRLPGQGARQVFVIEPAEALEPEGIARYLKTLEEPPPTTVFLLLTTRPERLPDTVRSRCRRLGFPPLTEGEVAERLVAAGSDAASAARLARLASGSLDRAQRLAGADVPARLAEAWEAARAPTPGAARAVERLLAALEVSAEERAAALDAAEPLEGRGSDRKNEALRSILQDLLHAVAVEARDAAAGRGGLDRRTLTPRAGLDLLERTGRLAAAVASRVSPSVVLHDLLQALEAAKPA